MLIVRELIAQRAGIDKAIALLEAKPSNTGLTAGSHKTRHPPMSDKHRKAISKGLKERHRKAKAALAAMAPKPETASAVM